MTLTEGQVAALREVSETWPDREVVIIGATALGFYFDMSWRKTADVDLVVALEVEEFPGAITERHGWTQHPKKEHAFESPTGEKLDILPAGPSLLEAGVLKWPSGVAMSLRGVALAFAHAESHACHGGYVARVAPPAVVAVLKMTAYCDRPTERERDLTDIAHLLTVYVDDDSERHWEEAIEFDWELHAAYLLGRDIQALADDTHGNLVEAFLARVEDPNATEHAVMRTRGPATWKTERDPLERRLAAFRVGFDRVTDL